MNIPKHWQKRMGPLEAFEMTLPPSWKTSEQSGSLVIAPGTGSGYLTVRAQPLSELESAPDLNGILSGLFPKRREIKVIPVPDAPLWQWGRTGEAVLSRPAQWWRRLITPLVWQPWVLWVARSSESMYLALYLRKGERDPEEEYLIQMALGTLTPRRALPQNQKEFLSRVQDFLQRRYPQESISASGPLTLKFGETTLDLRQAWKEFLQTPESLEEIVLARLRPALQSNSPAKLPSELTWEKNRNRVMPMLLPEEEINQWQPMLAYTDWIAGLKIVYVLDEPDSYRYINRPLFLQWGVSLEELHLQALENLDGYFAARPMEIAASQDQDATQVLLPVKADAYNTSRLLSESFQKILREHLGREYAVGIPSRDLFVAMRIDHSHLLSDVRRKIIEDFPAREFPLSQRMLLISPDGISELTDGEISL